MKGSPHQHWPQKSLFGTNLEPSKFMGNVNYENFLNGSWNAQQEFLKQQYMNKSKVNTNPEIKNIRLQLEKQKELLKSKEQAFEQVKTNALRFAMTPDLQNPVRLGSRSKSVFDLKRGIRTYKPTKTEIKNSYQLMGNILDSTAQLKTDNSQRNTPLSIKSVDIPKPGSPIKSAKEPQINRKIEDFLTDLRQYPSKQTLEYSDGSRVSKYDVNGVRYDIVDFSSSKSAGSPTKQITNQELTDPLINLDDIPANIRHKFGSKQTRELILNQAKVGETLTHIEKIENSKRSARSNYSMPYENINNIDDLKESQEIDNSYVQADISNFLRHAVCHGSVVYKQKSHNEQVYTGDINKKYLQDPENYKMVNRRKKDWLGSWTDENNVIMERNKKFFEIQKELAKATSFLPPVVTNRTQQKQRINNNAHKDDMPKIKAKPNAVPKRIKNKNGDKFEDFEFLEPDFNEPPPPPNQPKKQKDDEFWKFYDKKATETE